MAVETREAEFLRVTQIDPRSGEFGLDVRLYSEASPDHVVDEDFVMSGQNFAVVLDARRP